MTDAVGLLWPRRRLSRALTTLAALCWSLVLAAVASAQVTASVDRTTISIDEVVTLQLELDPSVGRANVGQPEGEDFTVVGTSTYRGTTVVNGRRASSSTVSISLRPVRVGELQIGRVAVQTSQGTTRTEPITITVTGAVAPPNVAAGAAGPMGPVKPSRQSDGGSGVSPVRGGAVPSPFDPSFWRGPIPNVPSGEPFMIAFVSDGEPTRGQQVVVDYVLFKPAGIWGMSSVSLSEPAFEGFWFQDISDQRTRTERPSSRRVGRETYEAQVVRSYALFPLRAGSLEVPPLTLDVDVSSLTGPSGRRRLTTAPLTLEVSEPPEDGRPAGFAAGNVGAFQLQALTDLQRARVGDTVTLTVTVSGYGMASAVVLPDLPAIDGLRAFPPDDTASATANGGGWVQGSASRRVALVATREGDLTIPALSFPAFDPWEGRYLVLQTAPIALRIAGVAPSAVPDAEASPEPTPEERWIEALPPLRALSGTPPTRASAVGGAAWYPALVAAPPVAWAVVLALASVRRRRDAGSEQRRSAGAARAATQSLEVAGPAEVDRVVREYVAAISGEPTTGLTAARVAELAQREGGDAGRAAGELIRRSSAARFGGDADTALVGEARAWIQAMETSRC